MKKTQLNSRYKPKCLDHQLVAGKVSAFPETEIVDKPQLTEANGRDPEVTRGLLSTSRFRTWKEGESICRGKNYEVSFGSSDKIHSNNQNLATNQLN